MTGVSVGPRPVTSYIRQNQVPHWYCCGGAPMTMLKIAFVPLQCTAGSRTAIDVAPWKPLATPKPASCVRLRSVPFGYRT